jgi:uncharacterized protein YqeY
VAYIQYVISESRKQTQSLGLPEDRLMIDLDLHIKTAMKSRDPVATNAYRSLKHKVSLKLMEAGRAPGKALTEEEFNAAAKREIKERVEANQFLKPDHATFQENTKIIQILESHLPKGMSPEELEAAVQKAIAEANPAGPKEFGKVMAALKKAGGAIDMAAASARVKALLEAKAG